MAFSEIGSALHFISRGISLIVMDALERHVHMLSIFSTFRVMTLGLFEIDEYKSNQLPLLRLRSQT